ncbi:MAG: nucleotide exchange factor GrpE [Acidimicrobiia bacterium]
MSGETPAPDPDRVTRSTDEDAPRRAAGRSRPARGPRRDRTAEREMLDAGSVDDTVDDRVDDAVVDHAAGDDASRGEDVDDEAVRDRPAGAANGDAGSADGAGRDADDVAEGEVVHEASAEDGEPDDDLDQAAEQFEVDLELLLSEREEYLEAFRRTQADFENYRKQAQRRQEEAVVRALGGFVESLLPVFDACDAALSHGAREVEPILSALYTALNKEGLERIDPKGAAFDPTEAEAVAHEPAGGGEHVVAEVLRPGYRWRGRVLRPAMVKVTD